MADPSQIEAELFAALGVSFEEKAETMLAGPADNPQDIPEPVTATLPALPALSAPSAPSAPLPTPPVTASPIQPPPSAPTPTPGSTAAATLPAFSPPAPADPPALDTLPPSLQSHETLLQSLEAAATDGTPQQSSQAAVASETAPLEHLGTRSPKRQRSLDGFDDPQGSSTKRQRIDFADMAATNGTGAPNLDLASMLNDALAGFDHQANPGADDILMPDIDAPQPPPPPADPIVELEKAENKIAKASSNPFYIMRSMSLPVLGNIAVQILLRLSQQPRSETEPLLADPESEFRRAYDMLLDIFRPTRRAFSDSSLLSPDELDITDSEDRETIRMSNLATTAASVFGTRDVSLDEVHNVFFAIFIPEDGEYKSSLTDLLVCIKTRLLLDALNKPEQPQPASRLLDVLFPVDFDDSLKQRSGDLLLNPDEESLVSQMRERRELLVKSAADEPLKKSLEEQSSDEKVAESLSLFLQGHLALVVDYADKYGVNLPLNEDETTAVPDLQQEEHDSLAALLQSATSHLAHGEGSLGQPKDGLPQGISLEQGGSMEDDGLDLKRLLEESLSGHLPDLKESTSSQAASAGPSDIDSKNLASLISEKLKDELDMPTHGLSNLSNAQAANLADSNNVHPQYMAQLNNARQSPYSTYPQGSSSAAPVGPNGEVLPPNQSMSTALLYEKARQAAVAKSSNTTRREGLHSTRRPWTPEEEKALMAGLDMVKGPHWSQILGLFGQHGTLSDILKDRTQVQLKDKARNLKLFFLKTNSEMPYYLQSVTGELKTRAPSQAARKEAEEKARMNLEEEQARLQGIMTLAGGLQNNHHAMAGAPLAASPPKRPSPVGAGMIGTGPGSAAAAAHMAASNGQPAAPSAPRIKTEASDHHPLVPKGSAFPPIQPAPGPGVAAQHAARPPLPALQPQPGPQHQPSKQQASTQQQQLYQQSQASQPRAHMPQPQQRLPAQQQQTQPQAQAQAQLQQQAQAQQQAQVHQLAQQQLAQQQLAQQQITPHQLAQQQLAQQQQLQQLQAQRPAQIPGQAQLTPQPSLASPTQPTPTTPQQVSAHLSQQQQPRSTQITPHPPTASHPNLNSGTNLTTNTTLPNNTTTTTGMSVVQQQQPLPTPPIPPNHHSAPAPPVSTDLASQDVKLFETLQAAIAASVAGGEGTGKDGQGQGQGQGQNTAPATATTASGVAGLGGGSVVN